MSGDIYIDIRLTGLEFDPYFTRYMQLSKSYPSRKWQIGLDADLKMHSVPRRLRHIRNSRRQTLHHVRPFLRALGFLLNNGVSCLPKKS